MVREFAKQAPPGRPEEIAAAVPWLASPEAPHVTGSDIAVSGRL